ncbi:preprotein translocase subunit YajC [Nocardioides plantarum]|uniref:Preprotein translocase subunit YajC n=1 Tax=Nocardioides plantarum TaxID=29299 RepID=A0ABV5KEJ8_9ACTN|nr:preprotein translocase subunit YajC [Nocardioides plantarum]
MEGFAPVLPILGIALVFWLLVIRPGVRRERERRSMQAALAVGDRVLLTSGFFGTIRALHDDRADIELAPGTTVTVALGAVGGLEPDRAPETPEPTTDLRKTAHPTTSDAKTSTPEPEEN